MVYSAIHSVNRILYMSLALLGSLSPVSTHAQLSIPVDIPTNFQLDRQVAVKLRPTLIKESEEPQGAFTIGTEVLRKLTQKITLKASSKDQKEAFNWELRITKTPGELNAYSSPDGTIYVDRALAQLLASRSGFWAAALSHEVAHILRRDWARRYLYEKALRNDRVSVMGLGDATAGTWSDPMNMGRLTSQLSQSMETDADAYGIMLMARAGYHPDFMFTLHQLLRARGAGEDRLAADPLHPQWAYRDEILHPAYLAAGHEFERLWPETYASPGGNPPILVATGEPSAKKRDDRGVEVRVPLHCSNLSGAVEVVLEIHSAREAARQSLSEWRQLTGCTSDNTLITFPFALDTLGGDGNVVADVYVIDDSGTLLSRSERIKLRR
jgi:Peptidase family M48